MAKTRKKVQAKRKTKSKAKPKVKKAAVKTKAKSRANTKKAAKKKTAAKTAAKPKRRPQRFTVSHHREEDFDAGLRPYSAYRDLGIAVATDGLVQAHVIRMTKPFETGEVDVPHYHDVEFQMVYVLKGWFQSEFEGEGVQTFHAGACWIQPPRIKHTVRGYSDDCELLEIILPADFDTVMLEA
ncbi:MAG: cupin domain-containing protein [Pseudolabrys sp.]|jgi:quercetin dioxygenase-like cupin family protein